MYNGSIRTVDHMLNRVNYTRVFDLAGVAEAVDEVSKSWEVHSQQINERVKAKVRVIEDSEDEDEPEDNDEACKDKTIESLSNENDQKIAETINQQADLSGGNPIQETVSIGMIVIDTISNVVTAVMSKSQVQGNCLTPRTQLHIDYQTDYCIAEGISFIDCLKRSSPSNEFYAVSISTHITPPNLYPSYKCRSRYQQKEGPRIH